MIYHGIPGTLAHWHTGTLAQMLLQNAGDSWMGDGRWARGAFALQYRYRWYRQSNRVIERGRYYRYSIPPIPCLFYRRTDLQWPPHTAPMLLLQPGRRRQLRLATPHMGQRPAG